MTNTLKRVVSIVLSFVMAMTCLVFVNVTGVSAYVPETLYKYYANATDATNNGDSTADNAKSIFTNGTTGSNAFTAGTYNVDGKDYDLKYCTGNTSSINIVVPDGVSDASFSVALQSSSSTTARTVTLKKNGVAIGSSKSVKTATVLNYTGLSTGTYILSSNSAVRFSLLTLKVPPIYTVSGTVTDGNNNPIKCATVYLDGDSSYQTRTEKDGDYSIVVPYGKYTMTVTALEHTEESKTVAVGEDTTVDFVLQKCGDKVAMYKHYGHSTSASSNYDSIGDNATDIFPGAATTTSTSYPITNPYVNVGGSTYYLPYGSAGVKTIKFVVPEAVEHANFYGVFGTNAYVHTFTLSKDGKVIDSSKTLPASSAGSVEYTDLSDGTYTLTTNYNAYPALLMLTTSPYHIVSGKVTDIEGNPIKCATVDTSWGIEVVTDNEGNYSVRVPEGKNTFNVTALEYTSGSKSFTSKSDMTVNFKLEKYGNKVKTYKYYGHSTSANSNYDSINDNDTDIFPGIATTTSTSYPITNPYVNVGGSTYYLPYGTSGRKSITINVPEAVEHANFYGAFGTNAYLHTFTLSKNGKVVDNSKTLPASSSGCLEYLDLSGGTYTLTTNYNVYPAFLMLTTSAEHVVSGVVTDTEENPIKCAKITTSWGLETRTDNEGKYTIGVPEGTNTVNVTALGYTKGSETFTLDEDIDIDFTLKKDRNYVYKFYGNATDASANYESINDNATDIFPNITTSTNALGTALSGEYIVEGSAYNLSYRGAGKKSHTIVVPEGVDDAELYVVTYTSAVNTLTLKNSDGDVIGSSQSMSGNSVGNYTYTGLKEGTYTLTSTSNIYPMLFMLATSPVYTISGTVTNTVGEPMKSAHVYIGDKKLTTDKDGKYSVDVGVDNTIDNIKVTALGYKEKDEKVSINGEAVQDIVIHKNRNTIHKFYGNATDATANYDNINDNATDIFTDATASTNVLGSSVGGNFDIEGSQYNLTHRGAGKKSHTIVVPEGVDDGELYMVWYTSAVNTVKLNKDGEVLDTQSMSGNSVKTFIYRDLKEGTYTFTSTSNLYPVVLILATSPVYTLSGTVTNANGNPIKCGNVYIGDDARLRTDGTGGYTIDVAEGSTINNIKVTALGYEDKDETVSISDETTNDITIGNGDKDIVYKFFSNQNDAVRNYDSTSNNNTDVFTNALTGSTSITRYGGGDFDIEGSTFKLYFVSNNSRALNVVVPEGITDADLYMIGKASSTPVKLTLSKDGDVIDDTKTMVATTTSTVEYNGLSEGTYTIKSNKSFKYSLLAIAATQDELPVITEENVTSGVKVVSEGMASDLSGNSLFAEMLEDLNPTDKLFTLVGMVTGKHKDSSFMNKINQVGFVLYDADVVDGLGEDAKTMNPRELKNNYSDANFAGVTIRTGNVYKNYYDEGQYDESLDSESGYTGEASLEESENKSYFAYVVALSEDKRYYAYPFTLYNGTNINSYDESITDRIEIAYNGVTTSYINNNVDESVEINTEDNTESESVENVTENTTENTSAESDTTESTSVATEEAE